LESVAELQRVNRFPLLAGLQDASEGGQIGAVLGLERSQAPEALAALKSFEQRLSTNSREGGSAVRTRVVNAIAAIEAANARR
jgi:hypothetical protein